MALQISDTRSTGLRIERFLVVLEILIHLRLLFTFNSIGQDKFKKQEVSLRRLTLLGIFE